MSPSAPLVFRLALGRELRLWAKAGRTPVLWWRDDDARAPTDALDRLLDLSERHAAPVTLAVIAGPQLPTLVRRLESLPGVEIAVHGFKHVNRQPLGEGFGEVVADDDMTWVRSQLLTTTMAFHRAGAQPTLFVPPWNNVAPQLLEALADSPLRAVSAFDQIRGIRNGVPRLDAHLDVLRWKGGGRFRGSWRVLSRLRRRRAHPRTSGRWGEPNRLLTPHQDHAPATWLFLERFLAAFPIHARQDLANAGPQKPAALSA